MRRDQGYVTLATRSPVFLEMAVDLALSLAEHDPSRGVSVVVDGRLGTPTRRLYSGVFDRVLELPPTHSLGRSGKFCVADVTPYAASLYLDADTLAIAPVDRLWSTLSEVAPGLAMVGEMLDSTDGRLHHGSPVEELCKRHRLDRYFKCNSSLFFVKGPDGRGLLEECLYAYRDEVFRRWRWSPDEVAFGIVGARRGMAVLPHPWPFAWPEQLGELRPEGGSIPFFTALAAPPRETFARLLSDVDARRTAAGLPVGSGACWRWKAGQSSAGRAGRWLIPIVRALLARRLHQRYGWRAGRNGVGDPPDRA